jgi:glycosyltransferase involved in cell wall biosynthesis
MRFRDTRSALAHHWFFSVSGGERVSAAIYEVLEEPNVFCLAWAEKGIPADMKGCTIVPSFIQRLPYLENWYRYYAFLFPLAVELLDLRGYDLVVTSDASVMKGIVTSHESCHICYCHSPMRYAWNMFHDYKDERGRTGGILAAILMHYLRLWDVCAAHRVDYFVANSRNVRNRIKKYYGRDARVIYPPCDTHRFRVVPDVDNYYLLVGRLVSYKRADVAVRAFSRNGRRLLVAGSGPELRRLTSMAAKNVEFLGHLNDDELVSLYSRCRAVIFPGEEDFGIVPVEAQASGRPVIAFGNGGVRETVIEGETGLFFMEQTPEALEAAIRDFERREDSFDSAKIRRHAEYFGKARFKKEFAEFVEESFENYRRDMGVPPQGSATSHPCQQTHVAYPPGF